MLILSLIIQLNTCAIIEDTKHVHRIQCTIPQVETVAVGLGFIHATIFTDYYLAVLISLTADKRRTILTFAQSAIFK